MKFIFTILLPTITVLSDVALAQQACYKNTDALLPVGPSLRATKIDVIR